MKKRDIKNDHSKTDQELKKIHDRLERQELLFNTEALLPKENFDRELEKYELRNGFVFTEKDLKKIVREAARSYFPMFPNSIPFFKLMYKLLGWTHLDPNKFQKPPIVGYYIKKYIYARFPNDDVLPTLLTKDNPIIYGYVKKYKLFQFLNDQGIMMLEGYIKDAIEVMEKCNSWYEFEKTYGAKYRLSVQLNAFEES